MPVMTLIVDDAADIRLLVRTILSASGRFEIVGEAETGRQALELVVHTRPDLVVLDLSMPEMDGLEALPQLLAASPLTRVVVLSGHSQTDVRATALRLGASGYVDKSTAGGRLEQRLLEAIGDGDACS